MAARRACQNPNQDPSQDLAPGPAKLRIKALCATSVDRSSRETRSALSGFTKRINPAMKSRGAVHFQTTGPRRDWAGANGWRECPPDHRLVERLDTDPAAIPDHPLS